jgi:hypothetical protein
LISLGNCRETERSSESQHHIASPKPDSITLAIASTVAASNKHAPAGIFKALGDHYLGAGDHTRARAAYDSALRLGFDSSTIMSIRRNNPRLNGKQ